MSTVGPPSPEGLFDSYVYYENNFTAFDHPDGVWWKYMYIIKPGLAILHNGLPERTSYNDAYNLYLGLLDILICLIDLVVQGFCARTIWRSKSLSKSVKWFLIAEMGMRIQTDLQALYAVQCSFNYSCVDDTGYPFSWLLLNQIWSSIFAGRDYVLDLWAFGLSFSRIFAIFFNGLHYAKVERLAIPYIGIVFLLVEGLHIGMIVRSTLTGTYYYTGYYYYPNIYASWLHYSSYPFGYEMTIYICYLGYAVIGMALSFDLLTLWKIRKMKKLSTTTKSRADFRLAVMMITTHCFNAIVILVFQLCSLFAMEYDPLLMSLTGIPINLFPSINAAVIIAFNYPFKPKNKENRVLNQSNKATVSQNNGSEETQMTKVE